MSDVLESSCAFLKADTGSGKVMDYASEVYPRLAIEGAEFPYVTVAYHSPPKPSYAYGGISYESSMLIVKGVDRSISWATVTDLAAAIKTRLHDGNVSISGKTLLWLRWHQDFEYSEVTDGVTYLHKGALYRVEVSA